MQDANKLQARAVTGADRAADAAGDMVLPDAFGPGRRRWVAKVTEAAEFAQKAGAKLLAAPDATTAQQAVALYVASVSFWALGAAFAASPEAARGFAEEANRLYVLAANVPNPA